MLVVHKTLVRGVLGRPGSPAVYIQNCQARVREGDRERILTALVSPNVTCILTANEVGLVASLNASLNQFGGLKAEVYSEDGRTWAELVAATVPATDTPAPTLPIEGTDTLPAPITSGFVLEAKLAQADARLAEQKSALAGQAPAPASEAVPSWMDEDEKADDGEQDVIETPAGSTVIVVPGLTTNPDAAARAAAVSVDDVANEDVDDDEAVNYVPPAPIAPEGVVIPPPRLRGAPDVTPVLSKRGRPLKGTALARAQRSVDLVAAGGRV